MSLRINNNIAAVNGHRNMVKNDAMISKSLEKLSSGLRINKAADDAAGLIISEQMRAQLAGLEQATANTETGVTMVQTAEGAMDEMNSLLKKARQLAIHSANAGVNDTNQLQADQNELDEIVGSITRIASNTQFGTKKLLDGTLSDSVVLDASHISRFQNAGLANGTYSAVVTAGVAGAISSQMTSATGIAMLTGVATLGDITGSKQFSSATTLTVGSVSVGVASGATIDAAIQSLNTELTKQNAGFSVSFSSPGGFVLTASEVGSYSDGAQIVIANTGGTFTGTASATGSDASVVVGSQTFTATRGLLLSSTAGGSLGLTTAGNVTGTWTNAVKVQDGAVLQIGANKNQTVTVSVASMKATDLGLGKISGKSLNSLSSESWLVNGQAQNALDVIDQAINDVTNQRGALGAIQADSLETTLNSLRVTSENLTAAESTIRDVDYAKESAAFTRNSILVQASTAMLAQANQLPQNVLKLLG